MKTQRIKKTAVLVIALLMITGTNLFAQRGRQFNDQARGMDQPRMCYMIPDLTEEQEQKIEALRLEHLKEMNVYRNQMGEFRAKKRTLMTSDNSDLKEINLLIDQITGLHNKMMKTTAKHRQSVRNLLTDEQKVYFDSHSGNRGGRGMGMGRHSGYGRGDRPGRGYNPNCFYNNSNN